MNTSLQKIKKVSHIGSLMMTSLLLATPIFFIIKWAIINHPIVKQSAFLAMIFEMKGPTGFLKPWMISWSFGLKVLGLSADLIGHLPLWLGFLILQKIFNNYQQGMIFTDVNVRSYRYLGWLFLINALLVKPLFDSLMILVATLHNPPGQRILSLGFGTANLEDLFWGGFVMVVAWVMLEGNKLQEEQLLTI